MEVGWRSLCESSVEGSDFMVGSVQGAAGKVKVRDWHFAGTQRSAR